jgi:glycine oxidase
MADSGDVVIVGGGAAGCSTAYYLGKAGIKATIIEGDALASQASGFAAGSLNPLEGHGIPGPLGAFAVESFKMHRGLPAEIKADSGFEYEYRVASQVTLALDELEIPKLQETFDVFTEAAALGSPDLVFETRWLDTNQALALEPRLSPKVIQGLYTKGTLAVDSYKYTVALAEAAQKMGASVISGRVTGLERTGGRVTKVLLEEGEISCDAVVLAMGPWSRTGEPWLDAYIPVDPLKGELLRLKPPGPPLLLDLFGGASSLYPKPGGLVWCGTTEDWVGFDRRSLESTRRRIMEWAERLFPPMAQAELVLHTACLRPVTPDWLPIIGKPPGYENVVLATGAGKKGILLAPAMGKAAADLVASGVTQLPVAGLEPGRFSQPGTG